MGFVECIGFFPESNGSSFLTGGGSFTVVSFEIELIGGWGEKGDKLLKVLFLLVMWIGLDVETDLIAPEGHFGSSLIKVTLIIDMIPKPIWLGMLDSIPIKDLHFLFVVTVFSLLVDTIVMSLENLSDWIENMVTVFGVVDFELLLLDLGCTEDFLYAIVAEKGLADHGV